MKKSDARYVWEKRIGEIVNGTVRQATWLRYYGVPVRNLTRWKKRFKQDGTFERLRERMGGFQEARYGGEKLITHTDLESGAKIHISTVPPESVGQDYLIWKIRRVYGLDPLNGDRYVFPRQCKDSICVLQCVHGGIQLTKWTIPGHIFRLPEDIRPDGTAAISRKQFALLSGRN